MNARKENGKIKQTIRLKIINRATRSHKGRTWDRDLRRRSETICKVLILYFIIKTKNYVLVIYILLCELSVECLRWVLS